jgi:hypothetical protein
MMNRTKERTVAIAIFFDTPGVTQQQYDEVIQKLEATGEGVPPGRHPDALLTGAIS